MYIDEINADIKIGANNNFDRDIRLRPKYLQDRRLEKFLKNSVSLKQDFQVYFAYQRNTRNNHDLANGNTKSSTLNLNYSIYLQGYLVQPRSIRTAMVPEMIHLDVLNPNLKLDSDLSSEDKNREKINKETQYSTRIMVEMGVLRKGVPEYYEGIFYYWGNRLIKKLPIDYPKSSKNSGDSENPNDSLRFACWVEFKNVNNAGRCAERSCFNPNLTKTDFQAKTTVYHKQEFSYHSQNIKKNFKLFIEKMNKYKANGALAIEHSEGTSYSDLVNR